MTSTLDLSSYKPITSGESQWVYEVPEYPNMIIKVDKTGVEARAVKIHKQLQNKLIPFRSDRSLKIEAKSYYKLNFNRAHKILKILPQFYGVIQTSKGIGLVYEKISQPNGELAPTLKAFYLEGTFTKEHLEKLNEVIKVLFSERVVVQDLHSRNIVYANNQCFVVDGVGDKNFIPLRTIFKTVNRYKYRRGMWKLAKALNLRWNKKTDQFEMKS